MIPVHGQCIFKVECCYCGREVELIRDSVRDDIFYLKCECGYQDELQKVKGSEQSLN